MTIKRHDFEQGSDAWIAARCGLLTASEMHLIVTQTLKSASNDKERAHLYDLMAQRITSYVEPTYISDSMMRGQADEVEARILYEKHFAPVETVGFITNDKWGFTLGYSPDGLVGDKGAIECKSRMQKHQLKTLVENVPAQTVPDEFVIQVQTGLLVAELDWLDFVSYCGGMPMCVIRAYPDPAVQDAIIKAATDFEARLQSKLAQYWGTLASGARLVPTERKIIEEMYL